MILDVVSARHIRDYEIELEFEDGAKGIVDFSPYRNRGGVFSKFNDMEYFKNCNYSGGHSMPLPV